jgi:hypothetical protein
MKWLPIALIAFLIQLGSANLFADKPLANHVPNSDITGLVLAKFQNVEGEAKVGLRIPAWKEELQTEEYTVEIPVTEIRTQEVTKNGKKVIEEVEVTVTKTETRTGTITKYSPKESIKGEVALESIRAWSLKGKELTAAELKEVLSKTSYLLCLYEEPEEGTPPLDPFFANAFRSDLVIVYSDAINELLQSSLEPEAPPAAQDGSVPAAPAPPDAP